MEKENRARDQPKAQWSQFRQSDKTACIRLCNCGGVAGSYIELLTCLELKTDPKKIPQRSEITRKSHCSLSTAINISASFFNVRFWPKADIGLRWPFQSTGAD
jgi:hypothetical protein